MGERGTVFVLSSVHWHFTWQRHHEVSSRLAAAGFTVVYVEPLPKRWPRPAELGRVWGRLTGRRQLAGGVPQVEPPGVAIVSPRLLPDTHRPTRAVNRRLVARLARRLDRRFPRRPRIVLHYLPLAAAIGLGRDLDPDLTVYDCVWDWPNDPYSRPATLRESELLRVADLVFADSPYLVDRMRAQHHEVHQLLPAVDYERWAPARTLPPRRPRPLCAYFGAIGANLDLELLRRLARSFPLRLIGPVQVELGDLGAATEIVGPVPRERLPALLADVEVLVLPYREGGHARGVIPAKTFECLATGRPTIVKGLPSLAQFADLFTLCADDAEFVAAVERAPAEAPERREARLAAARRHDWGARIDELIAALDGALAERRRRG